MRCFAGIVGVVVTVAVTLALVAWRSTPPPAAPPAEPAPPAREWAFELAPDVVLVPASARAGADR